MKPLTTAKLLLALISVVLFAVGIRTENNALRLAAIGFLTAAVLLRFIRRG